MCNPICKVSFETFLFLCFFKNVQLYQIYYDFQTIVLLDQPSLFSFPSSTVASQVLQAMKVTPIFLFFAASGIRRGTASAKLSCSLTLIL